MSERKTPDIENNDPQIHVSKSFYEKITETITKSPTTAISSICALFIVIILSAIIPLYFPSNKSS